MRPTDYGVERHRVNRQVYHSPLGAWMLSPAGLAWGLLASVVAGVLYPVTLWLTLPGMLLWAPSMLLMPWQMPMYLASITLAGWRQLKWPLLLRHYDAAPVFTLAIFFL